MDETDLFRRGYCYIRIVNQINYYVCEFGLGVMSQPLLKVLVFVFCVVVVDSSSPSNCATELPKPVEAGRRSLVECDWWIMDQLLCRWCRWC